MENTWLHQELCAISSETGKLINFSEFKNSFEKAGQKFFDAFLNSDLWWRLREWGLLLM